MNANIVQQVSQFLSYFHKNHVAGRKVRILAVAPEPEMEAAFSNTVKNFTAFAKEKLKIRNFKTPDDIDKQLKTVENTAQKRI